MICSEYKCPADICLEFISKITLAHFVSFFLYRWTSWELSEPRSSVRLPAPASIRQSHTLASPGAWRTRSPTLTSWTSTVTRAIPWLTTTAQPKRSWSSATVQISFKQLKQSNSAVTFLILPPRTFDTRQWSLQFIEERFWSTQSKSKSPAVLSNR